MPLPSIPPPVLSTFGLPKHLHRYIYHTHLGFAVFRHPLYVGLILDGVAPMVARQIKSKRAALRAARLAGNIHSEVFLHERPFRQDALAALSRRVGLSSPEFWRLAASVWMDLEQIDTRVWSRLLASRHAVHMTEPVHRPRLASTKTMTIYRGCVPGYERGLSWTTSRAIAVWFARRFNPRQSNPVNDHGLILTAYVNPSVALAAWLGDRRGEEEVIVRPSWVRDARPIREFV